MSTSDDKTASQSSDVDIEANIEADKANVDNTDDMTSEKQPVDAVDNGVTIVDFEGPDDPENPMNWSSRKKAFTIVLVTLMTVLSCV